jgi:hypothetical protein
MLFTRRWSDCHNRTELPPNGADAILPTSCGNVHVAHFKVVWEGGGVVDGGDTAAAAPAEQGQRSAPAKTDDATILETTELAAQPCSVREHGAKGDNTTEDTTAIAAALAACAGTGRATVVPPGTYLIRPVEL